MPKLNLTGLKKLNKIYKRIGLYLILVLGISSGILFLLRAVNPSKVSAAWFDDTYAYRHRVTFTHNANTTANLSITFTLDTAELITANLMQSDCDDTRFTDGNGKLLPHDLTGTCNNASTTYEVIFPSVVNGTNVFYVYYGNPSAVNSEIDSTFYPALTPSGGDPSLTNPTTSGSQEKSPGPISYWTFDDGTGTTAQDSTMNNKDGTLVGTPDWRAEDMCVSGKCLYFDGTSNDRVYAVNPMPTGDYTYSVWVRPNSVSNNGGIFATESSTAGGDNDEFVVYIDTSGGLAIISNGASTVVMSSFGASYQNRWAHIEVTRAGSTISAYVDGQLRGTATDGAAYTFASTCNLYIGVDPQNGCDESGNTFANPFQGFIDEPKVYNFAKTADQVKAEFASRGTAKGAAATFGPDTNKSLSQGLVGYWKMDESSWATNCSTTSVTDSSGNGLNGAPCPNASAASLTGGKFGNGGNFDGTNDYVNVADNSILDFGSNQDFSVSIWIKSTQAATFNLWPQLVSKMNGDSIIGYAMGLHDSNVDSRWYFQIQAPVQTYCSAYGNSDVADGSWHHLVSVRNGNGISLYQDGVYVGTENCGNSPDISNSLPLNFGSQAPGSDQFYNGQLDEARVYNRALSPAEVAALYNWAPGPVGHWKLDENTGTTVKNTSGANSDSGTTDSSQTWARGKYGSGLRWILDPNNDSEAITMDSGSSYTNSTSQSFTLSSFIKVDSAAGLSYWHRQAIIGRPAVTNSGGCTAINGLYTEARSSSEIYLYANILYQSAGSSCNQATQIGYGSQSVTLGRWYYATVTFNGENDLISFYIDGILIGTATWGGTGDWTFFNSLFYIGGNTGSGQDAMDFTLDDIRVYNYARTQKQIIEDMNAGHPAGGSPIASQVVYYAADEQNGSTLNNSNTSQSSLTASITGATWNLENSTVNCKLNGCLDFDGTDDETSTTNADAIDLNVGLASGFTISSWVYADTDGEGDVGRIWDKGTNTYCRTDSQSGSNLDIECSLALATTNATLNISSGITTGTWNHIAVSYTDDDDDEITIWINGKNRGSSTNGSGAPAADTAALILGGDSGTTANFDGRIDEFKLYSSELTASEILIDMNAGSTAALGGILGTHDSEGFGGNPPIGWWKMDEKTGTTTADSSGGGYTGTLTNGPTWATGKFGSGVNFDGGNDYITTGNVFNPTSAYTVSMWAYLRTTSTNDTFFSSDTSNAGSEMALYIENGTNNNLLYCNETNCSAIATSSNNVLTDNSWQHIAFVYDGSGTATFYVNGINVTSDSSTSETADTGNKIIGNYDTDTSNAIDGIIDDVRIYNYARTPAQVAYDYNRGLPVAHYQFDECSGSTAYNNALAGSGLAAGMNGTITIGAGGSEATLGDCTTASTAWGNGATGKYNASLDLDGTDDYVVVADNTGLDISSGFSLSAWVNLDSLIGAGGFANILTKGRDSTYEYGYGLDLNENERLSVFYGNSSGVDDNVTGSTSFTTGTWYHVVGVVDDTNNTCAVYVNGILDGTNTSCTNNITANNYVLGIGALPLNGTTTFTYFFPGRIDDVKIFNYPLSASQVQKAFNEGAAQRFGPSTGTP